MELTAELLRAEDIRRQYGGRGVVNGASLSLRRGEVLAVLGPNGAGKSTLFRILLLLERADAGRVIVAGRPAKPGDRAAALHLAGVFQRPHLFAGTVTENLAFGLVARGASAAQRRARVRDLLVQFDLEAHARADVRTLSGGELQRVAVARALAVEPDVLLLDEPTANLDVAVRRPFREDLERAVRARAGGVLLITHDPSDAFALADRIAVLEAGKIVQAGTPQDLVAAPTTPFIAAFTGAELLVNGMVESVDGELVTVRTSGGARVRGIAATASGLAVGARAHASYRPEDVTFTSPEPTARTSATNRYELVISSVVTTGSLVRLRLDGEPSLTGLVTRESAQALELAPGVRVEAHVKATAVRVYAAG